MTSAGALDYQVRGPFPAPFQPLTLGSIVTGTTLTPITLPFDFDFYGQPVREFALSRYGYLAVGGGQNDSAFNQPIPHNSAIAPSRFITPWWDAFATTTTPTRFSWQVSGVPPSRQATFEWRDVGLPSSASRVSMQVTLFESTGVIRFSYGTAVPGTASGSIGLQRALGVGLAALPCSSTGTCPAASWPAGQAIEFVPRFQTNATCGSTTASCTRCNAGEWCRAGQCELQPCNFLTCDGCCFNAICYPRSGQNSAICGVNGAICDACPAGASCTQGLCTGNTFCDERNCADGCCSNATTCVRHSGQLAQTCGTGGSLCRACPAGFTCQAGQCVPPSPCLVVSEEAIDFGNVAPNCRSLTRTVRLTNTCFNNQTVSAITLAPGSEFQLGALPAFPLTVGLGLTSSFTVNYRPTNLGPDTATISIASSNGIQTLALIGVGGSGVNIAGFTAPSKTDVLLVLDNSCSMTEEQQGIATNPGALFGFAFDAGVDFHFGIATTDEPDLGALRVAPSSTTSFVTQRTVPFVTTFANLVNVVGINGGPTEAGLVSASLALRPPQVAMGPNIGFLRHDAALSVWFVSDAPDQSLMPATHYLDLLRRVKADPNRFSAHGVLATLPVAPSGCTYDGAADPTRYAAVINSGNGVLDEICTTQWGTTLEHVGAPLFGRRETWFLQTAVDPLVPVSVSIDGVTIPQSAQTWSFDLMQNAVRFTPASAPRPRQQLVITTSAACLP